jgi:hypothetical protein
VSAWDTARTINSPSSARVWLVLSDRMRKGQGAANVCGRAHGTMSRIRGGPARSRAARCGSWQSERSGAAKALKQFPDTRARTCKANLYLGIYEGCR